jgi:IclR family acetate operon transcriptional repressor
VRETGETATLSAPGEHDAITVDFAHSSSVVQSVAQLGRPSVGHATAAGKVMLAFGDVELPTEPLTAYTSSTITTRAALVEELERVRTRGFAEAREEREPGLAAIASPVRDSRGALAGIVGVQGPASRFDAQAVRMAVVVLLEHTGVLSIELGGPDSGTIPS